MLEVERISKAFGRVAAVSSVSFSVRAGEMLALIGPNGAGKSTCFNMVGGQIAPDSGRIRFAGRDLRGLGPRGIWRLGVGRTFQITATFASMTVRENVQMALISHRRRSGARGRTLARCMRPRPTRCSRKSSWRARRSGPRACWPMAT